MLANGPEPGGGPQVDGPDRSVRLWHRGRMAAAPVTVNATAAALLGLLRDGPATGGELVSSAESVYSGFFGLTRSQVYRELTAMTEAGLVTAGEPGVRERRPYQLTAAGRASFRDWLCQPPGAEQIRFPLLLTVGFARHLPPGLLAQFLATHRAAHQARLAGYQTLLANAGSAGELDPYAGATIDFGVRYEQAVLDWFDALPAEVGGDSATGG